jgi:U4/U6.U5 tri-snRNP-associated protein 2
MSPYVQPDPASHPPGEPIWYDLVANVTHEAMKTKDDAVEGEAPKKVWRVQLRDKGREEWYQVQDLFVEEVRKEILFLGESYVQIWERRREGKRRAMA